MNTQQIIELIKRQSGQVTGKIIKDLMKEHKEQRDKTTRLFSSYKGDVEIKKRRFTDINKVNSKLANDFRGDIVDQITGYLYGYPIKYSVQSEKYSESDRTKLQEELNSFLIRNNIDDLDNLTGTYTGICGYGARLCYIDREGKERVMNLNPWEVVFVYDATVDEMQYAMIYYEIEQVNNDAVVKRTKVEFYDKQNITFFISNDNGDYDFDLTEQRNPLSHGFDYIPVIKYVNNDTMQGDFEKVEDLIDGYDRMMSDNQNEIEEFRIAYFAFYGVEIDAETLRKARELGGFGFPEGSDGKFITKDLNGVTTFIDNHKKTLNENIYKFSKAVDMRDEGFSGGGLSGESRKWKLVGLENKAITKERKFTKSSRDMFKIIASAWGKKNIKFNPEDIQLQFTRNLPVDLQYVADVTTKLRGHISEETRLGLIPFVKDVAAEIEKMNQDNEAYNVNLDNVQ